MKPTDEEVERIAKAIAVRTHSAAAGYDLAPDTFWNMALPDFGREGFRAIAVAAITAVREMDRARPGRTQGLTIAQLGRIESGVVLSQVIEDHCGQPPEPPEEPAPILHYVPNGNISRCGIVWTAKRIITSRRTRFRDQVTCKKCLRAMAVKS